MAVVNYPAILRLGFATARQGHPGLWVLAATCLLLAMLAGGCAGAPGSAARRDQATTIARPVHSKFQ
ncbi:hypothetical protein [Solidesulfovibrio carbinolicus]|uniref:hypothetical protein n=1 Tax=Solidesulfovibrio carbinolicus TaxID=296842 RepID=UPI001A93887E|nr:hypothetical protein [Solidesulfovibrio carbinolicus]